MSDVFAIRTVRFINDSPVLGSFNSGNSIKTSVISFPRSPQPIYTTISASAHFASWCCTTVFPLPKGPGTAATPPFEIGNNVSITLCPVSKGASGTNFSLYGRPFLTGHFCIMVMLTSSPLSFFTTHTVSSTVKLPSFISTTSPEIP